MSPADGRLRPFTLAVPQSELDDLAARLDAVRWPAEIPDAGWDLGAPVDHVRGLVERWRHGYDWRAAERALNRWPQCTTEIDGATVHVAHLRSAEPSATPLLMVHGWPGSIVEFTHVAGPLTDPAAHGGDPADAVHLVLPTIPGFTLSGPTRERGWEVTRVAAAFAELMRRLGYDRYVVQGGDWGAAIARELGRTRPEVVGVHLTMLPGAYATTDPDGDPTVPPAELERARASWHRFREFARDRQGYADIQSTRPQTLAYGLTDSPVGQLAWIAEKFHEWAGDPVDEDLLLTNVMLYWLTRTAASSGRIYYERAHAPGWGAPAPVSSAPTALAHFPRENFLLLRHVAERTDNIVQWTDHERGGHFAALEQPAALVDDVRRFLRLLRG